MSQAFKIKLRQVKASCKKLRHKPQKRSVPLFQATPQKDVKVATTQNKIKEIVEITAKNEAIKIGTQTSDAVLSKKGHCLLF